jgi:hypothetical protein
VKKGDAQERTTELEHGFLDVDKTISADQLEGAKRRQLAYHHGQMLQRSLDAVDTAKQRTGDIIKKTNQTFWSITAICWLLIGMGLVMFIAAVYSAIFQARWDIPAVLSLTGFGNILAVYKFVMNRLQRSLGDKVQVQNAFDGYMKQIMQFDVHFISNAKIEDVKEINAEIREATLNSMELIQNYTEIGKPLKKEPWLSDFPITYEKLTFPSLVYVGKEITVTGTLRNKGNKPVTLKSVVIAVRPPNGTPSGGPFNYDFDIAPGRILKPNEACVIQKTKCIEENERDSRKKQVIPDVEFGKAWYAFMTCQTEDDFWHDDPNKTFFELQATEPQKPTKANGEKTA